VSLTDAQIELYSRQIILREVGGTGQKALLASRCLLLGGGAALEVAASYLAGAGVGTLDLCDAGAAGDRARALPALAQLEARGQDARIRALAPDAVAAQRYDVVLAFATDAPASRRPRLGALVVRAAADGGVELAILPSATSCAACLAPRAEDATGRRGGTALALASAGALAALACCRWLLALDADPAPRGLLLMPGEVVWRAHAPALVDRCTRGCPPRDEPV